VWDSPESYVWLLRLLQEVQQEVAAAMAHSRTFSHPRPDNLDPPPTAALAAPPLPPPPPAKPREDARELWPQLKLALCQIADSLIGMILPPPFLQA